MHVSGKCHCGNIAFSLEWPGESPEIPARACDCSFCVKHGGVWTSNPASSLVGTIDDAALVSRYAFGTQTRMVKIFVALSSRHSGRLAVVVA